MSASKTIPWCTLIVASGVVIALSAAAPDVLDDKNSFLKGFVGEGLLNVLGVILAITLASAAQLHLALIPIEERYGSHGFIRVRTSLRQACVCLISLFLAAVVLVVAKPLIATESWSQSAINGAALFILLWNILILISITQGTFALKADIKTKD